MIYSIFDSGNLVVSFDDEADAYDTFDRIIVETQDSDDGLLLVVFDDAGRVVCARR